MHAKKGTAALLCLIWSLYSASAEVRLPRLISDGAVLQRDEEINIWGWAEAGESVAVDFRGHSRTAASDTSGVWEVRFPAMEAGGPYRMDIRASNRISVEDIMIGDVWICSGQSNMVLPVRRVRDLYEEEIAASLNPDIRYFAVPLQYDFNDARTDLPAGSWKSADPRTVLDFSAAAYFFARRIFEETGAPIGLINASVGGTPIEAWMSEEALQPFPHHLKVLQQFRDEAYVDSLLREDRTRIHAWYESLRLKDRGYDGWNTWFDPDADDSDWRIMQVPGFWVGEGLGPVNGALWFRKEITLPESMAGKRARLNLGRIVDADSVCVNGAFVGATSYQYPPRIYWIPSGVLKNGENVIAVRVVNVSGKGGFVPDKPYEIIADGDTVDLKGEWKVRIGAVMDPLGPQLFVFYKPAGLFNGMIHPLLKTAITGMIWYQGESNTDRPKEYAELFPALIRDWRAEWNQGDFPFIYVQLANFLEASPHPSESRWAELREAQREALDLPNTAMAVAVDLGEWNDIHPLRKKEVGERLALAALNLAYGMEDVAYSGPVYESMERKDGRIVLSFSHVDGGLVAEGGGPLRGFAIAGRDGKFVWAEAKIVNRRIVVWSDAVPDPVAVRYAWADNPEGANLYNRAGLPASPFRTDTD